MCHEEGSIDLCTRQRPLLAELRTNGRRKIQSVLFRFQVHSDDLNELDLTLPVRSSLSYYSQVHFFVSAVGCFKQMRTRKAADTTHSLCHTQVTVNWYYWDETVILCDNSAPTCRLLKRHAARREWRMASGLTIRGFTSTLSLPASPLDRGLFAEIQ